MSLQTYQSNVARLKREIAHLEKQLADESKKESSKARRASQIERSMGRSTSLSTIESKQRELIRLADDIARIHAKKADIGKKIAEKTGRLHGYQQQLAREEERERKRIAQTQQRRERERLDYERALTSELSRQKRLTQETTAYAQAGPDRAAQRRDYDVFICHASEDKKDFVRPLAQALQQLGLAVWYDEFELQVGDSLRRSIDRGLANSTYGVVVLSEAFFAKNWPQYELDGLVAREIDEGRVVLPVWHKVSKDQVLSYSPPLADKVALNTSVYSVREIAQKLAEVVHK